MGPVRYKAQFSLNATPNHHNFHTEALSTIDEGTLDPTPIVTQTPTHNVVPILQGKQQRLIQDGMSPSWLLCVSMTSANMFHFLMALGRKATKGALR